MKLKNRDTYINVSIKDFVWLNNSISVREIELETFGGDTVHVLTTEQLATLFQVNVKIIADFAYLIAPYEVIVGESEVASLYKELEADPVPPGKPHAFLWSKQEVNYMANKLKDREKMLKLLNDKYFEEEKDCV